MVYKFKETRNRTLWNMIPLSGAFGQTSSVNVLALFLRTAVRHSFNGFWHLWHKIQNAWLTWIQNHTNTRFSSSCIQSSTACNVGSALREPGIVNFRDVDFGEKRTLWHHKDVYSQTLKNPQLQESRQNVSNTSLWRCLVFVLLKTRPVVFGPPKRTQLVHW